MVWGLKLPSGFGNYFPDADFVGYRERLREYFEDEMPPEEQAKYGESKGRGYVAHVVECFKNEPGTTPLGGGQPYRLVVEHEWPEKYELLNPYKSLGSLFMMNNQLLAVDADFKSVVESVEPDIHEFRPIEVVTHKGKAHPKQYYTMLVRQYLDSFSPTNSIEGSFERPSENDELYRVYSSAKKHMSGLAFTKSVMDDTHFWRERKLSSPEIFFSDALKAEFDKLNLRLPKHFKMKEV